MVESTKYLDRSDDEMAETLTAPHIVDMEIARKIMVASERRGMSQARVERLSGLPSGRLSKWTRGVGEPTGQQCQRIAEVLGVPVSWLVDDRATGEPPSSNDDETVLRVIHALGIDADEAIRRVSQAGPAGGRVPDGGTPPSAPSPTPTDPTHRVLRTRDRTAETRRRLADYSPKDDAS